MPYADPERRRQFHREYKRRWRKARAKIHPLLGFKIYICPRFPHLWVGRDQFRDSFLITDNREVQAQVEAHREFGKAIFPLAMDLTCTLREEEDE
jgi:hypothetical protein